MRWLRSIGFGLIGVVLFGAAFGGGYLLRDRQAGATDAQKTGFATFWQVREILARDFLGQKPAEQELVFGATDGLTRAYGDPYTVFVKPAPRRFERDELRGHFGGIGAVMGRNEAGEMLLTVMRDRPAQRAGIIDGDALLAVNGTTITAQMTVQDVVLLVRGDVGTSVTLTLRRGATGSPFDITVVRERIETPSVEWRVLDAADQIGYLHISLFGERTNQELQTGLTELAAQGIGKLVLDLRGNSGGLVDAAVEITSQFLREGVVLREVRDQGQERFYPVKTTSSPALAWSLVLLVDGGSASASEIVAGALRDSGRATLIGEKTFGKGSVQAVHELSDGSSLHVTVARWLTPNRQQIDGAGLEPDIKIGISEADRNAGRDPQLARARAWLRGER
jgi:carboxyl-terminal processing protease